MHSNGHPVEPEELMAYLDGELPVAQAAATADHLARCRECQAVAADLQSVSRRLMTWQVPPPGQGVESALSAAFAEPKTVPKNVPGTNSGWLRRWPWALGFAGACMLVLLFLPANSSRQWGDPQGYGTNFKTRTDQPLQMAKPAESEQAPGPTAATDGRPAGWDGPAIRGPLIIHTAQLTLSTLEFAKTRDALEALLARQGGHIAQMTVNSPTGSARSLEATLRVPDDKLAALITGLRTLGRVESESQGGEEVTQQVTDLEARLSNARTTEKRLAEILSQRTGKISDVLEVEKEMGRVRGEIERMVAERKNLGDRLAFATVTVTIAEEYEAGLQVTPPSASLQLRNSAVEGWRNLIGSLFGLAQFLLSAGPVLIVWAALLFFAGRLIWRRFRRTRQA